MTILNSLRIAGTALLAFLTLAAVLSAQESVGSISGRVADPQGALIPGATILITNIGTNAMSRTASNASGFFDVSRLNPGEYTVTVEAPGFKKSVRSGLVLSVAGRLDLEFTLDVGQVSEVVEVTAAAPLLDVASASGGRVIDSRMIRDLPFADMNPLGLVTLVPGVQFTGAPEYRRSFDNLNMSRFNTAGGVGSNEYTLDGSPVTGTNQRVGYMPPADGVEEFRLETANFDASYGYTSGASVNLMTKAGTNQYHGSLSELHFQQRLNGTPHFRRLNYEDMLRRGEIAPGTEKQLPGRSNNFGASLSGPVRIPKLYDGKDKLFFALTYNGLYAKRTNVDPATIVRTVPHPDWNRGDFSGLQAIDAARFTIYDPRSARQDGSRVVRTPFPGNRGIPVLNPMHAHYAKLFPQPNNAPGVVTREGFNNYYAYEMPVQDTFNSVLNRVDYNFSDRHRFYGRWYYNHRLENNQDWTYETKPGLQDHTQARENKGAGANYVWTLSDRSILDAAVTMTRFSEGNQRPVQKSYRPGDVGLPAYVDQKAGEFHTLPTLNVAGLSVIGNPYPTIGTIGTIGESKVQVSTLRGAHSLKAGWQERRYWFTGWTPGDTSGSFGFENNYTRAADNTNTAGTLGLGWASFMMGVPTSMTIDTNTSAFWSTRFRSLFVQDDWRLSRGIRLTLGLRYEREGGITERFDRGLAGGFDYNYRPPFAAAAEAAYARSPLAELPASQFRVLGGSSYLGQPNRTFTNGVHHILPRLGVVMPFGSKTVVRAGYGWYYDVYNVLNVRPLQDGFSQTTATRVTNDLGLTFCCGLGSPANLSATRNPILDPFPVRPDGSRFDVPYGNSLGPLIRQGRGYSYTPRDYNPAWQQRWRLGIQRELSANMMVEVSYNGAYSLVPVAQRVDFLPGNYWATGNTRVQAVDDDMNRNVPNPFHISNLGALQASDPAAYQYLSTLGFFTQTTIRKHQLLRAYPNINNLTGVRPEVATRDARGGNKYHDAQVRLERRFSRGLQTAVVYTRSQSDERDVYLNEFDSTPSWRPQDAIRPNRMAWQSIYELPFGKNRRWKMNQALDYLAGGWQVSWIYQYQDGPATNWGKVFFQGDQGRLSELFRSSETRASDMHAWFDPSISYRGTGALPQNFQGFEGRTAAQPGAFHVRTFPTRLSEIRADGIRGWDVRLMKRFRFGESLAAALSVDAMNATNHTNFSAPQTDPVRQDFGRVATQVGFARVFQFMLRLDF